MQIVRTLLILVVVSILNPTSASAQETSTKPRTQPQASSSPARKTRHADKPPTSQAERQPYVSVGSGSSSTPETSASQTPAATSSSEANVTSKTPNKPAEKQAPPVEVETPAAALVDPIVSLRDQIKAAATPQKRISLQIELADLLVTNNRKSEAIAELHTASSVDVFDPQGLYNMGNALARLGDADGAIASYRKAVSQRNGAYSRALNNLGVVLLRVGRWDEAFDALSSALKVENFRYAEASYNLGRLYAVRGQIDLASREWRRAIAIDPRHSAAANALARARNEERITVDEPVRSNRAIEPPSSPATDRSTFPSSRNASKPLALDPMSFNFLQKARTASERGDKLEAIDNYQRVLSRQSGYFVPANLELSFVLIGLKRNDEALVNLLQVTNHDGGRYPISYYHVARIYEVKGELKLAEDAFAQALAAYGNQNNQFLLDLSRVREKQGNFKGALEAMQQYIALVKKNGQDLRWSEERLTALQQKIATPQPK